MVTFYDASLDALSFVMPFFVKILPNIHLCLGLLLAVLTLFFLMRIVLSWYPNINLSTGLWPWVVVPTEPFLVITRRLVPPIGGVDVTPVIWVGLISLLRELIVGQQGVLSQILSKTQVLS